MKSIPLTRGLSTVIDDDDYERLARFRWVAHFNGATMYAARRVMVGGHKSIIYMHREIMHAPPQAVIDHINRNPLDNRKSNLRICTQVENILNSANADDKGSSLCPNTGRWIARVKHRGKRLFLGRFPTKEDGQGAVEIARVALAGGADPLAVVQSLRPKGNRK